ncbi:MAG: hypothetical protein JKY10_07885 [Cohaesibacteraceae bacterium]|nr:hypothetical protein [Cohaesibacteraceae bacterium]
MKIHFRKHSIILTFVIMVIVTFFLFRKYEYNRAYQEALNSDHYLEFKKDFGESIDCSNATEKMKTKLVDNFEYLQLGHWFSVKDPGGDGKGSSYELIKNENECRDGLCRFYLFEHYGKSAPEYTKYKNGCSYIFAVRLHATKFISFDYQLTAPDYDKCDLHYKDACF